MKAVLNVNVCDVSFGGLVEFQCVLPGVGLWLGAVALEDRVAGVEDKFQPGHFIDETKCMLCGKTVPVHTVLVDGLQTLPYRADELEVVVTASDDDQADPGSIVSLPL